MLISVGPDGLLGISNEPYPEDLTQDNSLGYPLETPWTLGTERAFYDPTNGTISTGNIYYFSGGLSQKDIVSSATANSGSGAR
jgi:hypothetical protein